MKTLARLMHKYKQQKHNVFHTLQYRIAIPYNFIRIKRFERHNDADEQKAFKSRESDPLHFILFTRLSCGNLCFLCTKDFHVHKKLLSRPTLG
jgi:hypothetical protein